MAVIEHSLRLLIYWLHSSALNDRGCSPMRSLKILDPLLSRFYADSSIARPHEPQRTSSTKRYLRFLPFDSFSDASHPHRLVPVTQSQRSMSATFPLLMHVIFAHPLLEWVAIFHLAFVRHAVKALIAF